MNKNPNYSAFQQQIYLGIWQDAVDLYTAQLGSANDPAEKILILFKMSECRKKLKQPDLVERAYREILELDPQNTAAKRGLRIHQEYTEWPQTLSEKFREPSAPKPDHTPSLLDKARALHDAGHHHETINFIKDTIKTLEKGRERGHLLMLAAECEETLGQKENAIDAYKAATQNLSGSVEVFSPLIRLLTETQQHEEARYYTERLRRIKAGHISDRTGGSAAEAPKAASPASPVVTVETTPGNREDVAVDLTQPFVPATLPPMTLNKKGFAPPTNIPLAEAMALAAQAAPVRPKPQRPVKTYPRTIDEYLDAIAHDRKNIGLRKICADLMIRAERYDEAREQLHAILAQDKKNTEAQRTLEKIALLTGSATEPTLAYSRAEQPLPAFDALLEKRLG